MADVLTILRVQTDTCSSQQTVHTKIRLLLKVQSVRSGSTLFAILSASFGFMTMTMTVLLYSKGTFLKF